MPRAKAGISRWIPFAAIVVFIAAGQVASADVVDVSPTGFQLSVAVHIAAPPDRVYAALIQPSKWWNSDHTFSGSAANLTLEAKAGGCFCEKLASGGSVSHLTVVSAMPGKQLRLRGALGPFQGSGVDGALTWSLAAAGAETDLTVTNDMGGHMKGGFGDWPAKADAMISDQVARLKKFVETGAP
jgi:uncharacterized protein YndB with AHSA1/START domain